MNKAKRFSFLQSIVISLSIMIPSTVYAADLYEKGNPVENYLVPFITLPNGDNAIDETAALLFINGTFIAEAEIIMKAEDEVNFVPVRLTAQRLDFSVEWDEHNRAAVLKNADKEIVLPIGGHVVLVNGVQMPLDTPTIVERDIMYMPLDFVAENLDASVVQYVPQEWPSSGYTYYYDTKMVVSPAESILRSNFTNIIIDERYDFSRGISVEEAKKKAQDICLEGLANFRLSLRENLIASYETPDRLNDTFENIETEINRMLYIGEVSRFYKFTIGPYDVLYDRINDNIFFVIHASETVIKEVDVHDPGLYMYIFVAG